MCKNCPTQTLCTLQCARQPYRTTGTVSQINMGITGCSKPRATFVMVFLCDRGGTEKASSRQSLAVLPRPYAEGNMQRLFQNAYPFPKALHLHWIRQMQLFQKNHLAKTIGKYQKHFHQLAIFSQVMKHRGGNWDLKRKINNLECSIVLTGHWICIPEKNCLRSSGTIKPFNAEFLLTHPRMTLTFHRSLKRHFCSKQTSYQL